MAQKIMEVTDVTLEILKRMPPALQINSNGKVTTAGWTNGKLSAYIYVKPPADGIYEFDFVADEPTGIVIQVISRISAEPYIWEDFPADVKGVKVYDASGNYIIANL